jgi:hypothetical protein
MASEAIHNPDQYISDLRLLLSQGRKRVAVLIGAGAPASIEVAPGKPLIPMVRQLTDDVLAKLTDDERKIVTEVTKGVTTPTVEDILSKLRLLTRALGDQSLFGMTGAAFQTLANNICDHIGARVDVKLPPNPNPYSHLVNWIAGTSRRYGVEIFTPNYDLLIEEALERAHVPYFDGFSGGVRPFFDAATVSNDELPSRWTRVWKLHGSLGWMIDGDEVIRSQSRSATHLIYPDHLKYDHTQKQPYAALFDRLRAFLRTPDALLITCGFSFGDAHIVSAIEEALAAYPLAAIVALQYRNLADEPLAGAIAEKRPNLSVYAADGAIISGVRGPWKVGPPVNDQWLEIRRTFWAPRSSGLPNVFTLGCFNELSKFLAVSTSEFIGTSEEVGVPSSALVKKPEAEG